MKDYTLPSLKLEENIFVLSTWEAKNHQCLKCKKSFYQKGHLNVHIHTIYEGNKYYKCDSCGKSFSQAATLKRHIHRIHKDHNVEDFSNSDEESNVKAKVDKDIKRKEIPEFSSVEKISTVDFDETNYEAEETKDLRDRDIIQKNQCMYLKMEVIIKRNQKAEEMAQNLVRNRERQFEVVYENQDSEDDNSFSSKITKMWILNWHNGVDVHVQLLFQKVVIR